MLNGPPAAADPEVQAAQAAMGLVLVIEEREPSVPDIWPENWAAVRLFQAMQSQLRVSFNGVDGLDYSALPVVERRLGLSPRQAREAFHGLRVMEAEMLEWHRRA